MLIPLLLFFTCIIIFSTNLRPVYAAKKLVSSPTQTSLVVDYNTGRILHYKNSTTRIYPASLTKLMTLYLLFEAVESGRLSMNQKLYVSKNAEKMLPFKLGLKEKETITVIEAILGLIIRSANDADMVVAENIKGTEENFARLMNIRARQLGMKDTYFKNASGWHHPCQKTTARDLAKLSIAIKLDFPKYYAFFSRNNFVFRGNIVRGHNKVNETYEGVDGLKTGYTIPAGYNLITAATRQNKSLVAIVTGGKSAESRNMQMVKLLDTHFDHLRNNKTMVDKLIVKTTVPSRTYGKKTKSTKVATNLKARNRKNYRNIMKNVAVIISGCGYLDGAEIFETVFTLLELDKHNINVKLFAHNKNQHHVINHLTQEKMLEERNILVESARIARGKIQPLNQIRAENFDALILPGGFGAALNLSDIGLKNENATVPKDLQEIIVDFYNLSKPIGAICIAPALLAIVLRNHTKIKVTLGESNDLIHKLGATGETCNAQDIVVDEDNRLVTTPAFMLNSPLAQIHKGIKGLVIKVLQMCTNI